MYRLTGEDINAFQRDGAICLRQVFDKTWLEKAEAAITNTLRNPSKYSESLGEPGKCCYFNDYCNWQTVDELQDIVYNSPAAEIAGKLMRSEYAVFYHEHVLTKDPGTHKVTPWHHDQSYYPVDGEKNCSIWMSIDPVPMETAIQFVRGSHRWGKWFYPRKFATEKNYLIDGNNENGASVNVFENVPDIDKDLDRYDILQWVVEPGDCVVFHMKTIHGAPSNKTKIPRRVISLRWLGDDCVLARRPWKVSPPVTGGLNFGDSVICDTFPLVWKSERPPC